MPWEELSKQLAFQARVFDVYTKRMRLNERSYEDDFYTIQSNDWVHVIPVTTDQQIVFVEQHRHGIASRSLECPGGIIDLNEEPHCAARRELTEETGYTGGELISLGSVHPNPAIQTNRCHLFVIEGVTPTGKQNLDPAEDISIILHPLSKISELISNGAITHALCIVTLQAYLLRQIKISAFTFPSN